MADDPKATDKGNAAHLVVHPDGVDDDVVRDSSANQNQKIGEKGKNPNPHDDNSGPTQPSVAGSEKVAKDLAALMKMQADINRQFQTLLAKMAPEAVDEAGVAPAPVASSGSMTTPKTASAGGMAKGMDSENFVKGLDNYLTKFEVHIMNEVKKALEKNNDSLKKSMGLTKVGETSAPTATKSEPNQVPGTNLKKSEEGAVPSFDELAKSPKLRGIL